MNREFKDNQNIKGKALVSTVLRIAWKASIYHIWRDRNRRMYDQIYESPTQLVKHVMEAVQLRTLGVGNIADDPVNKNLCSNCGLSLLA